MAADEKVDKQGDSGKQTESVLCPSVLYKYYAFNEWTQHLFEKNQIYFQSPDCFNDPFDSKINYIYEGTEDQRIDRLIYYWEKGGTTYDTEEMTYTKAKEQVQKGLDITQVTNTSKKTAERLRKLLGVFCMTEEKDNLLMWSHYADSHKGFCVGFDTQDVFWWRLNKITDEHYRNVKPSLNLIDEHDMKQFADVLLVKHRPWAYEKEWRIIDHINGPGVQEFPSESLVEVVLGCKITPENRNKIMNWCRVKEPKPTVFWAEENDREFKLDLKPIKY